MSVKTQRKNVFIDNGCAKQRTGMQSHAESLGLRAIKMTHSTTKTSSYTLSKYSRSYPTSAQTYSGWQHFTNPEIRLLLDVTKGSNSELQEVRLRVLWNINNGGDNQSQVVFASELHELHIWSYTSNNALGGYRTLVLFFPGDA
jgi:hypothetical protein